MSLVRWSALAQHPQVHATPDGALESVHEAGLVSPAQAFLVVQDRDVHVAVRPEAFAQGASVQEHRGYGKVEA
jgi:hypothetical protein